MAIKNKNLIIFGVGEMARMAMAYFNYDSNYNVVSFIHDDDHKGDFLFEGLQAFHITRASSLFDPNLFDAFVAISYSKLNQNRQEKYFLMKSLGYNLATYINSKSVIWKNITFGDNCFVLENQTIQPDVTIGNNVFIWSGNHIGHGSKIFDHAYISSHVVVSGYCEIGERCFLGVNSSIKDYTKIGSDCFIGMNSSVTKSLSNGSVVLNNNSAIYEQNTKIARLIKKKYFG